MSVADEKASKVKIIGADLFGFTVRNAGPAIAFYRDVLGLTPTVEHERGAEFTLDDGTTFGIYQPDEGEMPTGGGILFAVSNAHAAVKHFRDRGATLSDPMESPFCFMSFGTDPEGNSFAIHQRKVTD